MGRTPFSSPEGLRKGSWTAEEDQKLIAYIQKHGQGSWSSLPEKAGLKRCGKSCRLRWANYLRPGIKRGDFTSEEDQTIIKLHAELGNRWAAIAKHLPKRTDNEIKNYWHAHLKKHLADMGIDPVTHKPSGTTPVASCSANSNTSTVVNTDPMIIHESTAQESERTPQQPTSSRSTSASALLLNKLASRVTKLQSTVDPLRACQILQPNRTTGDDGANSGNITAISCHSTPSCQGNNTPLAPDISEYWLDNIGDPLSKPLNRSDMSNTAISPDSAEYGNASNDGGVSLDTNIDYPPSDALSTLENTGGAVVSAGGINVDVGSPVLFYNSNYLENELEPSDLFDIPLNILESTENFGPYA